MHYTKAFCIIQPKNLVLAEKTKKDIACRSNELLFKLNNANAKPIVLYILFNFIVNNRYPVVLYIFNILVWDSAGRE